MVSYSRMCGEERRKRRLIFLWAKNDLEIGQTTPLGDFPKGYNHQLSQRNDLQEKSTLPFFFRYGKYAIIKMQQRAVAFYVKTRGNCLELWTDKWTGDFHAGETISFSYSSPWLASANNRKEEWALASELGAWCNKSPYVGISMLCITGTGAPPGQPHANQNPHTSFIGNTQRRRALCLCRSGSSPRHDRKINRDSWARRNREWAEYPLALVMQSGKTGIDNGFCSKCSANKTGRATDSIQMAAVNEMEGHSSSRCPGGFGFTLPSIR